MVAIQYASEPDVDPAELLAFYHAQHHHESESLEKLKRMLTHSFCLFTARDRGTIIGFARGITDGVRGYLTECKLDPAYQGPAAVTGMDGRIEDDRQGIASELARRVLDCLIEYGVERIECLAYGTEVDFCEELGFKRHGGLVALSMRPGPSANPQG